MLHKIKQCFKNKITFIKTYWKDIHDVTTNRFLIFVSFCFALVFVAIFLETMSLSDYPLTPLSRHRGFLARALLTIFISVLALYIRKEQFLYWLGYCAASSLILLTDIFYLKCLPDEQAPIYDLVLTPFSVAMVTFYTYTTLFLAKYLYKLMKRILKEILATESVGLKRVLECITSIILSISALLAGIYGLISSFEPILQYLKK